MTAVEFSAKWDARFRDNDMFLIAPADLREYKDDMLVVFGLQAVNVPLYSPTRSYDPDYLVRWTVAGQPEAFYYARQAGKLPAPTGATDANWKLVPGPVAATALSQELTLLQAQGIEGTDVAPGRTYLINFGPDAAGNAQVVTLLGTAAKLFAIRGQLTVNGVRSSVRVNVASGVFSVETKADLDPLTRRLVESQAPEAEYPLYLDNGKYKYDDQALYLQVQQVGKRVNPLTGKLENDANYTTFGKVKVQPGVTYESVGIGIAYAAYIDVTNAWRQAWTLDANGASSANASYNSRAFSPPNNGSITEIYLWLSVRNDDVPYVRIRPTQLYNDAELRRLIAAVSNQTLFNYVPLAASSVDNYITASYFGSLYELSFGPDVASATNINVWLPIVTSANVKQSVVVRLLASQTGKTVSVYGRPAATAAGDRVLLQVLKPGDSAGFTVMSAYSSPYIGYGITFSTVLPAASGGSGGGGGVTPQQLEAVRSTVVIGATISGDVTLSLTAAGALLPVSTNSTITVPANADVPFGVGVVLELVPTTGAMPLVAAAAGVTILAATGNRGAGQGSPLRLTQLATDSWLLTGGA